MHNKELYHHGIKGMRWGIRRYQNKDGSLTPAGKKRAAQLESEYKALTGNNKKPKDLRSMTSREIQSAIKRKQLEDEYNSVMGTKQKGKYDVDDDADAATSTKGKGNSKNPDENQNGKDANTGKKKMSEMTDDDLRAAIIRKQLEQQYKALNPEPVSKGKQFVDTMIKDIVKPVAVNTAKTAAEKKLKSLLGLEKTDPNSYESLKRKADTLDVKKRLREHEEYFSEQAERDRAAAQYTRNMANAASAMRSAETIHKGQQYFDEMMRRATQSAQESSSQSQRGDYNTDWGLMLLREIE